MINSDNIKIIIISENQKPIRMCRGKRLYSVVFISSLFRAGIGSDY